MVSASDRSFLIAAIPAVAAYWLTDNLLVYSTALALYAYVRLLLPLQARRCPAMQPIYHRAEREGRLSRHHGCAGFLVGGAALPQVAPPSGPAPSTLSRASMSLSREPYGLLHDLLRQHPRRRPGPQLRGGAPRRPRPRTAACSCPRLWPPSRRRTTPRAARPRLPGAGGPGAGAVHRRRFDAAELRRLVERPMPASTIPATARCASSAARRLAARAVPRADAGLQGRRDAAARARCSTRCCPPRRARSPSSARPPATPARRRSRPSPARDGVDIFMLHPAGPRLRGPAPADDDGRRAPTCTTSRSRARSTTARTW